MSGDMLRHLLSFPQEDWTEHNVKLCNSFLAAYSGNNGFKNKMLLSLSG